MELVFFDELFEEVPPDETVLFELDEDEEPDDFELSLLLPDLLPDVELASLVVVVVVSVVVVLRIVVVVVSLMI